MVNSIINTKPIVEYWRNALSLLITFSRVAQIWLLNYDYKEGDTGRPVGNEDIYNNPEYMERLLESKKQIEKVKKEEKE